MGWKAKLVKHLDSPRKGAFVNMSAADAARNTTVR